MKAISLWQPWALLWLGPKIHETRGWGTSHRGPLAVHAAKRWSTEQEQLCFQEPFRSALLDLLDEDELRLDLFRERLSRGAILGVVSIESVISTDQMVESPEDEAFGDFSPGRYAWRRRQVWRLPEPIPYRGWQGLFDIDRETELRIRKEAA